MTFIKIFRIIEIVTGSILLVPPLLSAIFFVVNVFNYNPGSISKLSNLPLNEIWIGGAYGSAGFQSPIPFYFGLMALAGAYLIKDKRKALK